MALKIGVALFNGASPYSSGGNYACEFNGKPFEFNSTTDLPSQTLWVTNINSNDLYEAGLGRSPRIANDSYFRSRISQIVQELGLQTVAPEKQVVILATVLGCTAQMLKLQLGLQNYPSWGMVQAVGQLHGSQEPPNGSAIRTIAEASSQRYTACERNRRYEKAEVFSFWFPRTSWAKEMLSLPFPAGDINLVPNHSLPFLGRDPKSLVDWAYENKLPLFARVRIHGLQADVGRLLNYGAGAQDIKSNATNGGQYDSRNFREWCALPELAFVSNYGDVEIMQVAVAKGWRGSGVQPFVSKRSAISYAYGLAAENLWVGTLRKSSGNFNIAKTLRTAWILAEDRMRCLVAALKLQRVGMEITTYGNGRVGVVCPQSVRALIPQAALESGLLYPAALPDLAPYLVNRSLPMHVQQHLISSREFERNILVDQSCLKEMEAAHNAPQ